MHLCLVFRVPHVKQGFKQLKMLGSEN
uniref:Uncharacterized protein n=1 Tax=Anguilla anguilla TaxID=7936 RepID=A0A0E9P9S2_ANGAN